ncbi:hypothetical protein Pth03_36540 [Planotetraspora thailandica]|uniref:Uncharacterized protein n=1 Tax=Planotetraspora thailandica TaxID=487172 RepID=A0A8J3XWT5_9ACTN|nr:hypothetical protein Pth03_36540 [Planotetraspora thailandica]
MKLVWPRGIALACPDMPTGRSQRNFRAWTGSMASDERVRYLDDAPFGEDSPKMSAEIRGMTGVRPMDRSHKSGAHDRTAAQA